MFSQTCVKNSAHMGGGGGVRGRGHVWQGVCGGEHVWQGAGCGRCVWQGVCVAGGVHGRGIHGRGVSGSGGMCGRRDGHCSRRYVSYWNAFLLLDIFEDY